MSRRVEKTCSAGADIVVEAAMVKIASERGMVGVLRPLEGGHVFSDAIVCGFRGKEIRRRL